MDEEPVEPQGAEAYDDETLEESEIDALLLDEEDKVVKERKTVERKSSHWLHGKKKYGKTFDGFTKVKDIVLLVPHFKRFYYLHLKEFPAATPVDAVVEFNKTIEPARFHPTFEKLKAWSLAWDADIVSKLEAHKEGDEVMLARIAPEQEDLDLGLRTLGGELVKDALGIMDKDVMNDEGLDENERMRRRGYVLNVFGYATRQVQGAASLELKRSAEKRETASFLMDLLKGASAGTMSLDTIRHLKGAYKDDAVTTPEHANTAGVSTH